MGHPVKLEVELGTQPGKQVENGKQLGGDFLGSENPDQFPLLSANSRTKNFQKEGFLQHMVADGQNVSGEKDSGEQGNLDTLTVIKLEGDENPLLRNNVSSSSVEISAASSDKENSSLSSIPEGEVSPEVLKELEAKCAPYVRHDVYGTFGTNQLAWEEKCLLGLAMITLAPIRLVLIILIVLTYYFICKMCTISRRPGEEEGQENYSHLTGLRRSVIVYSGKVLARALLFILGFYHLNVSSRGPDVMHQLQLGVGEQADEDNEGLLEASRRNPGAIVSNHISYIDILYHMSASFPSFVAKRSVAKLPLIGLISKCMGCVYVQRESKSSDFKGVSGIVIERTRAAHENPAAPMLLLFPEGTTTNGDYLLPFKTGAFLAEAPVQPVILKYPFKRFSPAWESMSGGPHMLLLLCQFVNHLEAVRLPVYYPTAKECSEPKTYANNVRLLMSKEGNLPLSDVGLYEKRLYHAALAGKKFTRSDSSH
ncbi:hypothetical protein R1sor_000545 [Riccia sorocarpa]|uniref:Phospholipid/glycerol acyltransferase domain-containing protein n=1 Tax=Riccia sorocarpa TaxID=122646 RepID=A0ABD3GU87_9MARC